MLIRTYFVSRLGFILLLALLACIGVTRAFGQAGTSPGSNMDFESGNEGEAPPAWGGTVGANASGYSAVLDRDKPHGGKASARLQLNGAPAGGPGFGVLSRGVDAAPYRGKRVRLTAAVRVREEPGSKARLWMRVDRPERQIGFFDDMGDRPIRSASWSEHSIEGDVAPDAERIVFGLLLNGPGAAWIDDVRLTAVGDASSAAAAPSPALGIRTTPAPGDEPARALSAPGLRNLKAFARLYGYVRFFHPSDEAAAADWDMIAIAGVQRAEQAKGPEELAAALNAVFKPVAPSFQAYVSGRAPAFMSRPEGAAKAVQWRHTGIGEERGGRYRSVREELAEIGADRVATVQLGGGVAARVPLAVWRAADGKTLPRGAAPPAPQKPAGFTPSGLDRATRLAAAVSAWNVLQHFYPYFDAVEVDWQAELDRILRAAAADGDAAAFHGSLKKLIAALDDGHGAAWYPEAPRRLLPIDWEEVEGKLVVTAADPAAAGIGRGDVVTHIGGVPASKAIADAASLFSGSRQWVRWRGAKDLLLGKAGSSTELRLAGGRSLSLAHDRPFAEAVRESKPEPIAEIRPGILYVDLDRVTEEEMQAGEKRMAAAKALIFDLRGYPKGSPWYLTRLTDRPIRSARMEIPVHVNPDRTGVTWTGDGWNMPAEPPRFTSNAVFITNGSAISYSESVLGTVKANRLAEIVGEPTAGANGNVASFRLPGGYRIAWTGMRVLNRDGSRHHVVGVQPTIPASRTLLGVKAGRDELLEKALATVGARMGGG